MDISELRLQLIDFERYVLPVHAIPAQSLRRYVIAGNSLM
jgi:hypothetical protein